MTGIAPDFFSPHDSDPGNFSSWIPIWERNRNGVVMEYDRQANGRRMNELSHKTIISD